MLVSCLETVEPNEVIGLSVNSEALSLPADNKSTEKLSAYISIDSDKDKRSIEFETTAGVFTKNNENTLTVIAEDTVEIDNKQYLGAEVSLKSSNATAGEVTVSATIEAYSAKVRLAFTESLPTSLTLSSNKFGVVSSYESEATLTTQIQSSTGFPSSGYTVAFSVYDNADTSLFADPLFRNEKLSVNSQGQASVLFSAGNLMRGDSSFTGDLLLIATINEATAIADSILLNVSPNTN